MSNTDTAAAIRRLLFVADAAVADVDELQRSLGFAGEAAGMVNLVELDRAAAEDGGRLAGEGVRIATDAGLMAEPLALEAAGPDWKTIVDIAEREDAATIVMGSRGLAGLKAMLLGSVSSAVLHHADRPTLIVRRPLAHA